MQPTEAHNARESRTPDDDAVANQAHIEKLEKTIEILGEESPQAQGLIAALKQARGRAVVPPIGVRLDSCQAYVERAKNASQMQRKKLPKHPARIVHEKFELEQGLARLAQLREETVSRDRQQIFPQPSLNLLRATVAELKKGASVFDGSVGTTNRESNGQV